MHHALNRRYYRNAFLDSGLEEDKAESLSKMITELDKSNTKRFADKSEIILLKSELEKLELRLVIKLGAVISFWGSILVALIKF